MRFHQLEEWLRNSATRSRIGGTHASSALHILQFSQKFYLGWEGQIPERRGNHLSRLPFPLCAFEFEHPIVPVIVLAATIGESRRWLAIVFAKWKGNWGMGPVQFIVDPSREDGMLERKIHPSADANPDQYNEETAKFAGAFVAVVLDALEILNCSNVTTEIARPPGALNKKRIARGKPAIYEYKVLVLKRGGRNCTVGAIGVPGVRIHLRRGHIKRRKTGNFWWQPHVVGDKVHGVVLKDYRADQLILDEADQ